MSYVILPRLRPRRRQQPFSGMGITDFDSSVDPAQESVEKYFDSEYWAADRCYGAINACWKRWGVWSGQTCKRGDLATASSPLAYINGVTGPSCSSTKELKTTAFDAYLAGCTCQGGVVRAPLYSRYDSTFVLPCGDKYPPDSWADRPVNAGPPDYDPNASPSGASMSTLDVGPSLSPVGTSDNSSYDPGAGAGSGAGATSASASSSSQMSSGTIAMLLVATAAFAYLAYEVTTGGK